MIGAGWQNQTSDRYILQLEDIFLNWLAIFIQYFRVKISFIIPFDGIETYPNGIED